MIRRKQPTGIERCKVHKKPKKIDRIVKAVCIYWVIFVVVSWLTFWIKDSVPDTLIQYGLGGGAVELLVTGAIEIFRDLFTRKDGSNDEMVD